MIFRGRAADGRTWAFPPSAARPRNIIVENHQSLLRNARSSQSMPFIRGPGSARQRLREYKDKECVWNSHNKERGGQCGGALDRVQGMGQTACSSIRRRRQQQQQRMKKGTG